MEENNQNIEKNYHKIVIPIIVVTTILIIAMAFSTIFALLNINNSKIIKGVYIEGIDVSDLSIEEATTKVNKQIGHILNSDINLKYKEDENLIRISELKAEFDIKKAITDAYNIGRSKNIIQNNYEILQTKLFKNRIKLNYNINEEDTNKLLDTIESNLEGIVLQSAYSIDSENKELVITRGKDGIKISKENTKNNLKQNISNRLENNEQNEVQIVTEQAKPDAIDIEKIHQEIYKEPQDAYYTENPFQIYIQQDGVDFDISIEEAKQIIEQEQEEYKIPLKYTSPEITIDQISASVFPDIVSTFTTKYDASATGRATNISLVAKSSGDILCSSGTKSPKSIDGKVIMPGETFSFNQVVGNTTKEKGYQLATSYINGKMAQDYGGGTCQVSTTLYNAVLRANLEIVERRNHTYIVSYVDLGTDATIAYPTTDFKFKNTRNYAVKIVASAKNGILKIELYGVKEETEYEVLIDSKITQVIPYTTKTTQNSNLAQGKQNVIVKGVNGYKSATYKILKLNGNIISKELISEDTYKPMNREVEVGTKKQ